MAAPIAKSGNRPRTCSRCRDIHYRAHNYCKVCWKEYKWRQRSNDSGWREPGTAPAPPPGFSPSDLHTGKPYDG